MLYLSFLNSIDGSGLSTAGAKPWTRGLVHRMELNQSKSGVNQENEQASLSNHSTYWNEDDVSYDWNMNLINKPKPCHDVLKELMACTLTQQCQWIMNDTHSLSRTKLPLLKKGSYVSFQCFFTSSCATDWIRDATSRSNCWSVNPISSACLFPQNRGMFLGEKPRWIDSLLKGSTDLAIHLSCSNLWSNLLLINVHCRWAWVMWLSHHHHVVSYYVHTPSIRQPEHMLYPWSDDDVWVHQH